MKESSVRHMKYNDDIIEHKMNVQGGMKGMEVGTFEDIYLCFNGRHS